MRTRTKALLGVAAAGAVAAGLLADQANADAWSRGPGPTVGSLLMGQADADHDGKITKDEMDGYIGTLAQQYERISAEGLSMEDFTALLAEMTDLAQVRIFRFFDANGDGSITELELQRPADRFFAAHEEDEAIGPMRSGYQRGGPDGWSDEHEGDDA